MCTVTRLNFKQLRAQYHISTKEIADICNLSNATVNKFERSVGRYTETNARSYNADMMCQTLESLINRKELTMGKNTKKYGKLSDISRQEFFDNLMTFCRNNHIEYANFIRGCGIRVANFDPWYIEKYPTLSFSALRKIRNKTGWTDDDIRSGEFVNKEIDMSWIPANGQTEPIPNDEFKKRMETIVPKDDMDRQNVKLTCKDGSYYVEYDIIQHVCRPISKTTFLDMLKEEEEKWQQEQ